MKLVIVCIVMSFAGPSFAETCAQLIEQAEGRHGSDPEATKKIALRAVTVCQDERVKTARPYMVLATITNAQHEFEATVSWCKLALAQEPGLGLAYMDRARATWG